MLWSGIMTLHLDLTGFSGENETAWHWRLLDGETLLGEVTLDWETVLAGAPWLAGKPDQADQGIEPAAQVPVAPLLDLRAESTGPSLGALGQAHSDGPRPFRITLPPRAPELARVPFEQLQVQGKSLADQGLMPILEPADRHPVDRAARIADTFRILAILSLPETASADNLRREARELDQTVARVAETRQAAVTLRTVQHGATRDTLWRALDEGEGWDLVLISLRGSGEYVVLETDSGGLDRLPLSRLSHLLRETADRIKLVVMTWSLPPARYAVSLRRTLGLPVPDQALPGEEASTGDLAGALPRFALDLSRTLDCTVAAMRTPHPPERVRAFQTSLLETLLDGKTRVADGFHRIAHTLVEPDRTDRRTLLQATVAVCGHGTATRRLVLPRRLPRPTDTIDRMAGCPPRPVWFSGRLKSMMRATLALADGSPYRVVLFHGTVGAGKTACALEMAHRHEAARFEDVVWFEIPDQTDPDTAFVHFFHTFESRLQILGHPMTTASDDPAGLDTHTLHRFGQVLERRAVLLLMDHVERLLDDHRAWRSDRWRRFFQVALAQDGRSRLVLTSRFMPAEIKGHTALRAEPVHALDLDETLLLGHALPNLSSLFQKPDGHARALEVLRATQGHPGLLHLADRLLPHPELLTQTLAADFSNQDADLDRFLAQGYTDLGGRAFFDILVRRQAILLEQLDAFEHQVLALLARAVPEDRNEATLHAVLERLPGRASPAPPAPPDLTSALNRLQTLGLLAPGGETEEGRKRFALHSSTIAALAHRMEPDQATHIDRALARHWVDRVGDAVADSSPGAVVAVATGVKRATVYLDRARMWPEAHAMLEPVLRGTPTSATVALVLRLARSVAAGALGSDLEAAASCLLADALALAGQAEEAEQVVRAQMARSEERSDHAGAARAAGVLAELLMASDRSTEAVEVINRRARWQRLAGGDAGGSSRDRAQRLRALEQAGAFDEVLGEVGRMLAPSPGEGESGAEDGDSREAMLRTGKQAALESGQWGAVLRISDELVQLLRERGAPEVDVARVRLDDYWAVLKHGPNGYDEARALLQGCRSVFQNAGDPKDLGRVFAAQADLEDAVGHAAAAAWLAETGLRHAYQAGDAGTITLLHANLADYLLKRGASPDLALVHRLAAALLAYQGRSRLLEVIVADLARGDLPERCPRFDKLAAVVEEKRGFQFRAVLENLPGPAGSPQEAMAEVWKQVQTRRGGLEDAREARQAIVSELPEAVQRAFEHEGEAFARALQSALAALPEAEATRVVERLTSAGIIESAGPVDLAQTLQVLDPVLRGIAEVALGDRSQQARLVADIMELERKGWRIGRAVQRIWAGERRPEVLTADMDGNSAALVQAILALLEGVQQQGGAGSTGATGEGEGGS